MQGFIGFLVGMFCTAILYEINDHKKNKLLKKEKIKRDMAALEERMEPGHYPSTADIIKIMEDRSDG